MAGVPESTEVMVILILILNKILYMQCQGITIGIGETRDVFNLFITLWNLNLGVY